MLKNYILLTIENEKVNKNHHEWKQLKNKAEVTAVVPLVLVVRRKQKISR